MALVTIKPQRVLKLGYASAYGNNLIDASGELVFGVFQVPKTGNITKVGFRTGAVTTAQTLRVGLETVDATTGRPTGTQYGGSAVGTQASPAANTFYEVTLGTQASATVDNDVAIVVQFDGTIGNLNIVSIDIWDGTYPYVGRFVGGAWAKTTTTPVMSIEYDDGTHEFCGLYPWATYANTTYNNGSTPDERALRFSLPYKCRVWGAEANITTASGDADFVLYEGTTSLTSVTIDKDVVGTMSASRCVTKKFPSPQIITINTEYFLSVKPTSANSINLMEITTPSAAAMDEMELGQNCHFGSRTDAGAWTLDTSRRPMISLLVDQLDDGAGGSGGPVGANIRGGFSN